MELTHRFTVPGGVEETWGRFQDIASLAECFPGAQVTSVSEGGFEGTCKVKLGPIALVYAGSGTFVEKDDDDHRFVVEAKGRDKRGNGTAGATVTLSMSPGSAAGESTDVEVHTDLNVTGKPAQFGRGVMQDVSDKLLGQFVDCLEQRSAAPVAEPIDPVVEPVADPVADPVVEPVVEPGLDTAPSGGSGYATSGAIGTSEPGRPPTDVLNLGATVLPVLARAYWKQAASALLALAVIGWLVRRR